MTLAIEDGLLRCAAEINNACDGAVLRIEYHVVWRLTSQDIHPSEGRNAEDAVRVPSTSMVSMVATLFASNITIGLLNAKA